VQSICTNRRWPLNVVIDTTVATRRLNSLALTCVVQAADDTAKAEKDNEKEDKVVVTTETESPLTTDEVADAASPSSV